jgi:nucleoside-diphosphate-sugar epimerase
MNGLLGLNISAIYAEARLGDVRDSQADIAKAKSLLGYTPKVGLEEGLRSTLEWCRSETPSQPRQ